MLQDLYPHIYHNEMAWKAPAPDDYALIFAPDGTVYCDLTDGALTLPRIRDVGPGEAQYAFSIDEAAYYLVAAHPDETDAFRYVPAASLRSMTERTSPALFAAAAGGSLHRWYRSQQFCGRCGAKMEPRPPARAPARPPRPQRNKKKKKHNRAGHGLPAVQKHRLPEDLPGRHRRRA